MYFLNRQKTLVSEVAVRKAPICVTVTVPVFRSQVTIELCSSGGHYLEKCSRGSRVGPQEHYENSSDNVPIPLQQKTKELTRLDSPAYQTRLNFAIMECF